MRIRIFSALTLCALLLSSRIALAQSSHNPLPRTLSYQGVLSVSGNHPAGTRLLTVTLYGDANGTIKLWQGTMNTNLDSSGVFNCLLGSGDNPLPDPETMDRPIWLGVAVDGGPELRPLSQVTASAYALNVVDNAITTGKLADSAVTTEKLADHSVTWNKMGTEYVPYIRVNGTKVNTGQSSINFTGGNGLKIDFDSSSLSVIIHADSGTTRGTKESLFSTPDRVAITDATQSTFGGVYETSTSKVLHGGTPPSYGQVNLTSDVAGILPTANGGTNNIPQWATTESLGNIAGDNSSVVSGGANDTSNNIAATVGGGFHNKAYGDDAVVAGGEQNQVGSVAVDPNSFHSAIGGGANNMALGIGTAIPGGTSLKLGPFSFGYNGDNNVGTLLVGGVGGYTVPDVATLTDLSSSGGNYQGVAYFGNVNIMLGNVDTNARELQFYSPNKGNRNLTPGSVFYSSFRADTQDNNIQYTLPPSNPAVGQVLTAQAITSHTGVPPTSVQLAWSTPGNGGYFWSLTGNSGTDPGTNYIGTNDSEAFEIHVYNNGDSSAGNQRVMRYEPGDETPNIIGGSKYNSIDPKISSDTGDLIDGSAVLSGGDPETGLADTIAADQSTIVGGVGNTIKSGRAMSGRFLGNGGNSYSFIGNGYFNSIDAPVDSLDISMMANAIVAGTNNHILRSTESIISGGSAHRIGDGVAYSGIHSGFADTIKSSYANIAGGGLNVIDTIADYGVIAGGGNNRIQGGLISNVYGGDSNVTSSFGTITGGENNAIEHLSTFANGHAFIGGGQGNVAEAEFDVIAGGRGNIMNVDTFRSGFNFIGGGDSNFVGYGSFGNVITGGKNNISANGYGTIGGGFGNLLNGSGGLNVIGGGYNNEVGGNVSIEAGNITRSTIGGGDSNIIRQFASYSTIGGGSHNLIDSGILYATIPGGQSLEANANAQNVVGQFNRADSGSLFIVGNGTASDPIHRTNAFTVSNNGYTTAYQNLPKGDSTVFGSTYANNTIIAWGNVNHKGVFPTGGGLISGIGDSVYTGGGTGVYTIFLRVKNPDGTPHVFTAGHAAIVVTPTDCDLGAAIATATALQFSGTDYFFTAKTYASGGGANNYADFQFHVVSQ